jgi:abequosyltransferase
MTTPHLSICIPTYNRAPYLRECLDSIIASIGDRWDQVEIVISDNASPDDTPSVVVEYQRLYPQIKYNRNSENVVDRNFYIVSQLAFGEYVWLFGDDDKMAPQAVGAILAQIRQGYDLIVSNYSIWTQDLSVMKRPGNLPSKRDMVFTDPDELLKRFGIHLGYISAVIIRSALLFKPNYDSFSLYAEYGWGFLYAVYAAVAPHCRAAYLCKPLICNRADNSPISSSLWDRNFVTGSFLIFEALLARGYSPEAILTAQDRLLKDFVVRTLLGRVRSGENVRDLLKLLFPHYKRNCYFWLVCAPAAFIPRGVVQLATRIIRMIRQPRYHPK